MSRPRLSSGRDKVRENRPAYQGPPPRGKDRDGSRRRGRPGPAASLEPRVVMPEEPEAYDEEDPSQGQAPADPDEYGPVVPEPVPNSSSADDWIRLASSWQPSPQTWQPLAESWHQAQPARA